jgi:hypothetical protein
MDTEKQWKITKKILKYVYLDKLSLLLPIENANTLTKIKPPKHARYSFTSLSAFKIISN